MGRPKLEFPGKQTCIYLDSARRNYLLSINPNIQDAIRFVVDKAIATSNNIPTTPNKPNIHDRQDWCQRCNRMKIQAKNCKQCLELSNQEQPIARNER